MHRLSRTDSGLLNHGLHRTVQTLRRDRRIQPWRSLHTQRGARRPRRSPHRHSPDHPHLVHPRRHLTRWLVLRLRVSLCCLRKGGRRARIQTKGRRLVCPHTYRPRGPRQGRMGTRRPPYPLLLRLGRKHPRSASPSHAKRPSNSYESPSGPSYPQQPPTSSFPYIPIEVISPSSHCPAFFHSSHRLCIPLRCPLLRTG